MLIGISYNFSIRKLFQWEIRFSLKRCLCCSVVVHAVLPVVLPLLQESTLDSPKPVLMSGSSAVAQGDECGCMVSSLLTPLTRLVLLDLCFANVPAALHKGWG